MSETTVPQKDIRKIWEQLERLFDWAGTRSTPMAPANLASLREQVTIELNRVIERADALEQIPLLLEVEIDEKDGMRNVVIDMRDGTTRTFQTRVDWFDRAPGMPESAEALIAEAQAIAEEQRAIASREAARAKDNVVDYSAYEARIQDVTIRAERAEADLVAERGLNETQAERMAASAQRAEVAEERVRGLGQRIIEITQRAERAERALQGANSIHETYVAQTAGETERANLADQRYAAAEAERFEWRTRYLSETKVVNDALPSLAHLLVERTQSLEALEAAAAKAVALLGLKRFEKDTKASEIGEALQDALALRSDRSGGGE